jgi:triacylglycerol esterase/lipase EstA (alpha/beta hydrolase family)
VKASVPATEAFLFSPKTMLARIQQLIAVTLVGSTLAAFVAGVNVGKPWLGLVWVALVVLGYLAVLAAEFSLLRRSYGSADAARPTIAQLIRAWAAEVTCAPRVFLWHQPFASALNRTTCRRRPLGRGVLLVHGFFCNRGLWNPWLRRLRAADIPFIAVSLEPVFGSIDRYAQTIAVATRELERVTGLAPVIAAHSMGGLAARAWLAGDSEARVHRLVTIASPHNGTRLAARRRAANIAQMAQASDWLAALAAHESARLRAQLVCFWSHCDNIVFPTRNATLPGADNRHLEATPHVKMVFHPAVFDEVLRCVSASA